MSQVWHPHTLKTAGVNHSVTACLRHLEREETMWGQLVEGGYCSLIWVEMTADGRRPTSHSHQYSSQTLCVFVKTAKKVNCFLNHKK